MSMLNNPLADESFLFWLKEGFTRPQAAGLVAQEYAESSYNANAVGDHHEAFGLFQMHHARCAAIKHGCGIDVSTLPSHDKQLEAASWELKLGAEKRAYKMVCACLTAYNAGHDAARYWERPASHNDWIKRGGFATAMLADFDARSIGIQK